MNIFEKVLDGTRQLPRPIQIDYFNHLDKSMREYKIHGMAGPPGVGKSYIARTIQRALPNTIIITNNNVLVDQYCHTYPILNGVKGKDFYEDPSQYKEAQIKAAYSPSVFNPLSYYYFKLRNPNTPIPQTVIIDEAHGLAGMLLLTVTKQLSCEYFNIPPNLDDVGLVEWLRFATKRLEPFFKKGGGKVRENLGSQYEQLIILYEYIRDNIQTVKISYQDIANKKGRMVSHLIIQPLVMPTGLLKVIFGSARMILFSGSITNFHMRELFPKAEAIDFINYEPLAPKENRMVYYTPIPTHSRRDVITIAQEIRKYYLKLDRPNTLVHVSYALAAQLGPLLKDIKILTHTKETKQQILTKFKISGGILLASGMAEGVDLPGDQCRLIIIPILLYPNLMDDAIKKRMKLTDGQEWYNLTTMMTTVQQVGRGVRGADDACDTYIFDATFPRLIATNDKYLTQGFKEAIKWSI